MDTAIIDTWESRHVREDDDAYEGRINLETPFCGIVLPLEHSHTRLPPR